MAWRVDLEPASALAERILTECTSLSKGAEGVGLGCDYDAAEQLVESDRAAVREPLEARRMILFGATVVEMKRLGLGRADADWVFNRLRDISPALWESVFEVRRG